MGKQRAGGGGQESEVRGQGSQGSAVGAVVAQHVHEAAAAQRSVARCQEALLGAAIILRPLLLDHNH